MSIARTLASMLVIALAAGAFTPAAHAQARGSVRSGHIAAKNLRPIQVAELNQKKHSRKLSQRKHAEDQAKLRTAHITRHKKHRAYKVARKPSLNSILFRIAPYKLTMA